MIRRSAPSMGLLLAGFWLGCFSAGAAPGAAARAAEQAHDACDVVVLTPAHPLFVRLEIQVDGQGLSAMRRAHAQSLVERYDADGDGLLSKPEAAAVPPLVKTMGMTETYSLVDTWISVDRQPADDMVSADELTDFLNRVLGSTVAVTMRPMRATQNVDLFSPWDLDHDGRLTVSEFQQAWRALARRDADDDEVLTIDEIQESPGLQPGLPVPMLDQATRESPLLALTGQEAIAGAAATLLERYANGEGEAGSLGPERLGVSAAVAGRHDANGDGRLDARELTGLLAALQPQVVLRVELRQRTRGGTRLEPAEDTLRAVSRPPGGRQDRLQLAAGGLVLDLRAVSARAAASDNRTFFVLRFKTVDADKNKYLDEQEFAVLARELAQAGMANADFKMVDRNGDGMIVEEELRTFVDQEAASSQSRVELVVSHDGKSLFEVIDANQDRRLTRRELLNAAARMAPYDLDGDGGVTPVELAGRYLLTIELGKPALFRTSAGAMRGMPTQPVVNQPAGGPEWFRKMDRNRDGDLSPREFLGPKSLFARFDANGDGLISLEEAAAAVPAPAP